MRESVYSLNGRRRTIVLRAMVNGCAERGWELIAAHVRETHVHAIVNAACEPERILHDLKAYASRDLNRSGVDGSRRKRWTWHGSMRTVGDREAIARAVRYVVEGQGAPMAVHVGGHERAPCCRASGLV